MKKILVILSVVCLFGSCNTHPFVIADGEKGEKDDREGVYLHFLIVKTTTPQTSKFSMSLTRMAL